MSRFYAYMIAAVTTAGIAVHFVNDNNLLSAVMFLFAFRFWYNGLKVMLEDA